MIKIPIKKLFRRCLLIAVIGVAAGCASVKQMPSSPVEIQERSFNAVKPEVKKPEYTSPLDAGSKAVKPPPENSPASKVPDENFVLETPVTDGRLVDYISSRFKVSPKTSKEIVRLAAENAHETFPKRNDILALIAVESSYNTKAAFKGCYGLMQINKKAHKKLLANRSLYTPSVNIELGSIILNQYFELLSSNKKAAVLSFNAGIGNYIKHRYRLEYYLKYKKEVDNISKL